MYISRAPVSFTKLWKKANSSPTEFTVWTALLDLVEKHHFPYCYGYWKKWADMEKHKGNKELSLEVYRSGVKAIPLSIDLWTSYLDAAVEFYHGQDDYETKMRGLYEEAVQVAGLEFRSDALWEHYISWETGHNRLVNVVDIYTRLLQIPTQLYFQNWDSFNKLIEDNRPEDILSLCEFARFHAQVSLAAAKSLSFEQRSDDLGDDLEPPIVGVTKPAVEITDATRNSIRELLIASREQIYQTTYTQIMKRWYFEEKIRRPYFHVKPLEEVQLTNWAEYLSFEENEAAVICSAVMEDAKASKPEITEEELDAILSSSELVRLAKRRVIILYERCLIPCALYENFWIRYARYLEITERNIPAAREVWRRACTIHLKYKPTIHWHWGCFEDRYPSDLDNPPTFPVKTCLQILTELEERLTDSALVCCRRADAMRRAKKPLFDIIACLRSGINRLRYLSEEQSKLAKSLSGPTASRTVAQAIATSAQARAGAGVLAGRLARMLHRDELFKDGLQKWMLLLHTVHEESEDAVEESAPHDSEMQKEDDDDIKVDQVEKGTDQVSSAVEGDNMDAQQKVEAADSHDEAMESGDEERDEAEDKVTSDDEAIDSDSAASMDDGDEMDASDNEYHRSDRKSSGSDQMADEENVPPVLPVSQVKTGLKRPREEAKRKKRERKSKKVKTEKNEDGHEEDEAERARREEEERVQREKELAAEEEERIRTILDKRQRLIHLHAPPVESLTEEDKQLLSSEEAAILVLKEAIEYDPRNERLYAQLLDIVYQRHPVDLEGFIEMTNFAAIDSVLPATVKLAFCQRKLQFLEEFDSDMSRLHVAYEEFLHLCQAVNNGVAAAAAARGNSRFTTSYPLPDLLNLPSASARINAVVAAGSGDTLVSAGPVTRQPCLTTDQSVLDAAASVGTPAPDPSTSAGYFTAGAYEPLASALGAVGGLPPPVPTNIPVSDASAWATAAAAVDPFASFYYTAAAASGTVPSSVAASSST
ncbi:unnamed protein product [Dicrocoelium dendriticum]|nr:unnamed protein product [Dicrocoelium dendriticum]